MLLKRIQEGSRGTRTKADSGTGHVIPSNISINRVIEARGGDMNAHRDQQDLLQSYDIAGKACERGRLTRHCRGRRRREPQ